MTDRFSGIWVYLAQTPLFWLAATLIVFQVSTWLYRRTRGFALLHPVIISIVMIIALLQCTGTSYNKYFDGAQFIHFLLGPATVALAIPLYEQRAMLRRLFLPIVIALVVGSAVAIVAAAEIAYAFGASAVTTLSIVPKSVTTPIAMGISEQIGGIPALTAALVALTGIFGSLVGQALLNRLGIREKMARGFAMGMASHGMGTARSFEDGKEAGAFAGLAMGLNGAVTSVLAPILVYLLHLVR